MSAATPDTIETTPGEPWYPEPAVYAAGSVVPPDTTPYTLIRPTSSAPAYAGFGAIPLQLGAGQPFTYSFQFRIASFGEAVTKGYVDRQSILHLSDGSDRVGGFSVRYGPTGFVGSGWYRNGSVDLRELEVNRWYHIAFTWNGSQASFYLDGGLCGVTTSDMAVVKEPRFAVGENATDPPAKSTGFTPGPFVGDVKRLYVWRRCLTALEVAQQMWAPAGGPLHRPDVVLGYDFTTNPPTKIGSGPALDAKNLAYASSTTALYASGVDVAIPGQGSRANPGGGGPFSILAWLYVGHPSDVDPRMDGYLVSNGDYTEPQHFGLKLDGGRPGAEFGLSTLHSTAVLSPRTWYYVGLTYDGASCTFYVNGAAAGGGPVSATGWPSEGDVRLFGILRDGAPWKPLRGFIQFLSIWNVALTPRQVAAQAHEDPTLDAACTANFMMSAHPCLDSVAVAGYGLWDANQLRLGEGMMLRSQYSRWSADSASIREPRRPGVNRVSAEAPVVSLSRCPSRGGGAASVVEPFSPAHRQMMVAELAHALSCIESEELTARLLADYGAEVERVFDLAATSPERLEGPHVSYREVDGAFRLFYHPDADTQIDLGMRIDISQKCAVWWVTFVLTAVVGLLAVFAIPTPIDELKALAARIVADPAVVETLKTVTGLTFTAGTLLSLCKLLYDFGWLGQAVWLALSSLSWWAAGRFIVYLVGIFSPVPSPQLALFVANCVVTVAKLVIQLTGYQQACGADVAAASGAA